ncbi:hypothetical protein [Streptomyces sp. NPDC093600]|uniref:hypothetical protein n=1 Tax=Streptomyces sp. NPDC093600 TaxID=3366047 RepID=UPI00381951AF
MRDRDVTDVRAAVGRRVPAVLLLLALVALIAGVCHGTHGHVLPLADRTATAAGTGTVASAPAPALPHGCERNGEAWSFDVHLPAQTAAASQLAVPDAGGAVRLSRDAVPADPHARCVRGRAGPGPEPGSLLLALGVDRN